VEQLIRAFQSAWFWAMLFSSFALLLLLIFSDKYQERQAQIERKYQARAVAEDFPAIVHDTAGRAVAPLQYSTPATLRMKLWPVIVLLIATSLLSIAMLVRNEVRFQTGARA
jgi:hypothetical protein